MKWTPLVVSVFCAVLVSGVAGAADYTWTGSSGNDLSDTANWSPVPAAAFALGDGLIFPGVGITTTNLVNSSLQQLGSITFQAGALAYTLTGSNLKFADVTSESSANQTVLNHLDWQQFSRTYANNGPGTLTLGRILSTKPGKPLVTQTFATTGDVVVTDGMIAAGTPFDTDKTGPGALTIQGTYDYKIGTNLNATITVDEGTLDVSGMDINFEEDTGAGAVTWDALTNDVYTLIDYTGGTLAVNGANVFASVTGLDESGFELGHSTEGKRVYLFVPPRGTVITIR